MRDVTKEAFNAGIEAAALECDQMAEAFQQGAVESMGNQVSRDWSLKANAVRAAAKRIRERKRP